MPTPLEEATERLYEILGKNFLNPCWITDFEAFSHWFYVQGSKYWNGENLFDLWKAKAAHQQYLNHFALSLKVYRVVFDLLNKLSNNQFFVKLAPETFQKLPDIKVAFANGKIILSNYLENPEALKTILHLDLLEADIAAALANEECALDKLADIYQIVQEQYGRIKALAERFLEVIKIDFKVFKDNNQLVCMRALSRLVESHHLGEAQFINFKNLAKHLARLRYQFNLIEANQLSAFLHEKYTQIYYIFGGIAENRDDFKTDHDIASALQQLKEKKSHFYNMSLFDLDLIASRAAAIKKLRGMCDLEKIMGSDTISNIHRFLYTLCEVRALLCGVYEGMIEKERPPEQKQEDFTPDLIRFLPDYFNKLAIKQAIIATQELPEKDFALEQLYLDLMSATLSTLALINSATGENIQFSPEKKAIVAMAKGYFRGVQTQVASSTLGSRVHGVSSLVAFGRVRFFCKYLTITHVSMLLGACTQLSYNIKRGKGSDSLRMVELDKITDKLFILFTYLQQRCLHVAAANKIYITPQNYRLSLLKDSISDSPMHGIFNVDLMLTEMEKCEKISYSHAQIQYIKLNASVKHFIVAMNTIFIKLEKLKKPELFTAMESVVLAHFKPITQQEIYNFNLIVAFIKLMYIGEQEYSYYKMEYLNYIGHVENALVQCIQYEERLSNELGKKQILFYAIEATRIHSNPSGNAFTPTIPPSLQLLSTMDYLVKKFEEKKPALPAVQKVVTESNSVPSIPLKNPEGQQKASKISAEMTALYKKVNKKLKSLKSKVDAAKDIYQNVAAESNHCLQYAEYIALLEIELSALQSSAPSLDSFGQNNFQRNQIMQASERLSTQVNVLQQTLKDILVKKPASTLVSSLVSLKPDLTGLYHKTAESYKDLKQEFEQASKAFRALDAAGKSAQIRYPDYENTLAQLKHELQAISFPAKNNFEVENSSVRSTLITQLANCKVAIQKFIDEVQKTHNLVIKQSAKPNPYQKSVTKKELQARKGLDTKAQQEDGKREEKKTDKSSASVVLKPSKPQPIKTSLAMFNAANPAKLPSTAISVIKFNSVDNTATPAINSEEIIPEPVSADLTLDDGYALLRHEDEPLTQSPRVSLAMPDPEYAQDFLTLACQHLLRILYISKQPDLENLNNAHAFMLHMFSCLQSINEYYRLQGLTCLTAKSIVNSLTIMTDFGWKNSLANIKDFTNLLRFPNSKSLLAKVECWHPEFDDDEITLLLDTFCYDNKSKAEKPTLELQVATLYKRLQDFFIRFDFKPPIALPVQQLAINLSSIRHLLHALDPDLFKKPCYFANCSNTTIHALRLLLIATAQLIPRLNNNAGDTSALLMICQAEFKLILNPLKQLSPEPERIVALVGQLRSCLDKMATAKQAQKSKPPGKNNKFFAKDASTLQLSESNRVFPANSVGPHSS